MSSTNRSNVRSSHISDYYITPINKIEDFLKVFIKHEPNAFNGTILDNCAGGDGNHPMSYPEAIKQVCGRKVDTIDIREDSLADIKADFLTYECKNKYNLIITNPPFNISKDIILKALDDVCDKGFVVMLLRLNYFGSKDRKKLWECHMPKYVFVHHRRISFTENGSTDSIEYAHYVWQKGYKPEFTQLKVI